jgi:hypothetical protein
VARGRRGRVAPSVIGLPPSSGTCLVGDQELAHARPTRRPRCGLRLTPPPLGGSTTAHPLLPPSRAREGWRPVFYTPSHRAAGDDDGCPFPTPSLMRSCRRPPPRSAPLAKSGKWPPPARPAPTSVVPPRKETRSWALARAW